MWSRPNINILVVDDEEGVRETLGDVLENEGYTVLAGNNGVRARALGINRRVGYV